MEATQFLMPGFIDCHIHAPQMPNIGLGLDKDLLGWLNAYTFPLEAQYTDLKFAASVYKKVVVSSSLSIQNKLFLYKLDAKILYELLCITYII